MSDQNMTKEEISRFLPSLSEGELIDLEAAANADADEGVEWLPYYKMALNRLAECCGLLRTLEKQSNQVAAIATLQDAAKLFYEHLLFCGIGPRTDPNVIIRVEQQAAQAIGDW